MTAYSITISNDFYVFGLEATTKYGAATFGSSVWTYGDFPLVKAINKVISSSIAPDSTQVKSVNKIIESSFTPGSEVVKSPSKLIENSITPTFETSSEEKSDSAGWKYVFPKPTVDAENRSIPSYTSNTDTTTSWTVASTTSSTWG